MLNKKIIILVLALVYFLIVVCFAYGRDLGQWENADPEIRAWYDALRQPDNPNLSCCGQADAYWCDVISVENGQTFCTITDNREDAPLRRYHLESGTKIAIPKNKFGPAKWGNPTGHAIVFTTPNQVVYCFVQATGI